MDMRKIDLKVVLVLKKQCFGILRSSLELVVLKACLTLNNVLFNRLLLEKAEITPKILLNFTIPKLVKQ